MAPDSNIKSKIFQNIISLLCDYWNIESFKITIDTSLEKDLGMTGDDFDNFIILLNDKTSLRFDMSTIAFYRDPEFMTFKSEKANDLSVKDLVEMIAQHMK